MKILLIGATGQIGHALSEALATTEHELTVLLRRRDQAVPAGVRVVQADAFTPEAFASSLEGQDAVIYGIGLPEQFAFDTSIFDQVNLEIFRRFLQALEQSPVRRLVYISTYEVFEAVDGQIRENHEPAGQAGMTPYFQAMIKAYALAQSEAQRIGLNLTTIHPAAVYGGRNTGDGITNYLENLVRWNLLKMPANVAGRFPVVHAASLADAIIRSLDHTGAFLVSEGMTSMPDLAKRLRQKTKSYVPITLPKTLAYASATLLEGLALLTRLRPILARVQVDFITIGSEPLADKAVTGLGWRPLSIDEGLAKYLRERTPANR